MIGNFAFEAAIVAQIGPSVAADRITFSMSFEAGGSEAAVDRCLQRACNHSSSSLVIDLDKGGTAEIETLPIPGGRFDD